MLKDFLDELREFDYSDKTIDAYKRHLTEFERWLIKRKRNLQKHNKFDVKDYVKYLMKMQVDGKSLKPASIHAKAHAIQSFWKVERDERIYLKLPRIKAKLPEWLTEDKIKIIKNSCINLEEETAFIMAYELALRREEIVNVKVEDVQLDKNLLVISKAKGGDIQMMPVQQNLKNLLRKFLLYPHGEYLFSLFLGDYSKPSVWKFWDWIKQLATRSGLDSTKVYPHIFRHSKAIHLRQHGMRLEDLKDFLRHKSLQTVFIYAAFGHEDVGRTVKDIPSPLD